jgi:siroheme synthase (precorrin-2 oxidase/ferrochelatase)
VLRPFEPADLDGATLVFEATNDAAVNAAVVAAARARNLLVDDASEGARGDFATALAHRVGPLTFAVDTGGVSPSFAIRLQRELRERFDERYGRAATALGRAREYVKATPVPSKTKSMPPMPRSSAKITHPTTRPSHISSARRARARSRCGRRAT